MKKVLFVQGRTHKAGAQTCLARLLQSGIMRQWSCSVLSSTPGWFTEECDRIHIPSIVRMFPRSRSLFARMIGNRLFAKQAVADLSARQMIPDVVFANDHQEALIALAIAEKLGAKKAILLRSPGMRREDYFKYCCNAFDHISAIGEELTARVKGWDSARKIHCTHDGVLEDEFLPVKQKSQSPPSRILAIGSPLAWKGWADLTEALRLLSQSSALPGLQIDFTGTMPKRGENDLKLGFLAEVECRFLGRVEKFRELVRGYDLVINPSRMETFGMAAVEVVAAGVPLLSSRSGVIEKVIASEAMLFAPNDPGALASALRNLFTRWSEIDFRLAQSQQNIRDRYMIDHAAAALHRSLTELSA